MKEDKIQKFLQMEYRADFFKIKIEDVFIWKYFREEIYNLLLEHNYQTETRVGKSHGILKNIKFLVKQLWVIFFEKNNCVHKADVLFCNFPRKTKIDGKYVCTQLERLVQDVQQTKMIIEYPFWIEDIAYNKAHFDYEDNSLFFTDKMEIQACLNVLFNFYKYRKFKKYNREKVNRFIDIIENEMNIIINRKRMWGQMFFFCNYEKNIRPKIDKLLKLIEPKCFIEVYTPNRQLAVFNEVCHENGISVIDIQHGALNHYEPIMYSYYKKCQYPHLGDFIFVFGKYWKNKNNFHLSSEKIYVIGNPFLERMKKEINLSNQEYILILSQTRYHKLFIELCEKLLEKSNCKIVLKLHPYEYAYYLNQEYVNLEKKGVTVVCGLEQHLYKYFQCAICVVGINSTALYEALAFGVPVLFYEDKYSTENLQELKDDYNVWGFKDDIELLNVLDQITKKKRESKVEDLFAQYSASNIQHIITNIVRR